MTKSKLTASIKNNVPMLKEYHLSTAADGGTECTKPCLILLHRGNTATEKQETNQSKSHFPK